MGKKSTKVAAKKPSQKAEGKQNFTPFLIVFLVFFFLESGYLAARHELAGRLPYGTQIAGEPYGLLPVDQAERKLSEEIAAYLGAPLRYTVDGVTYEFTAAELGLALDPASTVASLAGQVVELVEVPVHVGWDSERLKQLLADRVPELETTPQSARVQLSADGTLEIVPEVPGKQVDWSTLTQATLARVAALQSVELDATPARVQPLLTASELEPYRAELTALVSRPLVLKDTEYQRFEINLSDRLSWFHYDTRRRLPGFTVQLPAALLPAGGDEEAVLDLNPGEFGRFVAEELAELVETPMQPAEITLDESGKPRFVGVAVTGRRIDTEELTRRVVVALGSEQREVELPYIVEPAKVSVAPDLASLGITELVGSAITDYSGSPVNRRYNIQHAANLLDGFLIAPGEEFSFIRALGPITFGAGYRAELVIKEGDVIPEVGGGVCQVSTTFFRAALDTGLPITAQKPHSLKVHYYSPPGLDATIYPGVADLKFINDTGKHLLIQTEVLDDTKIRVNLYGTSDGRVTELRGPYYPSGEPITNLARAGMNMYWERVLHLPGQDEEVLERYSSAYRYMNH